MDAPDDHRRRPRYRGTHPRRFDERYKEHDPAKHPDVVERVIASGRTPAGSHLPIMVDEVLAALEPRPGQTVVDATLGHGGHTEALLARVRPGGRVIALDVDPLTLPATEARLRAAGFGPEALAVHRVNHAALARTLAAAGVRRVDALLADLGCSSMQYDDPSRGFTYKQEGPLDLRMNPRKGVPASTLLEKWNADQLARALVEHADEPLAQPLARAVLQPPPPRTTTALAERIRAALAKLPAGQRPADPRPTLARVFQALRISVNDELATLDALLAQLPAVIAPGGRVAILTFHSGEDRRVKQAFRDGLAAGVYARISGEPARPSRAEVQRNPRARPAKLRWAVRSR